MDDNEIRSWLTKHLRGRLDDREWDLLDKRNYFEVARAGDRVLAEADLRAAVDLVKDMRDVYVVGKPSGSTATDKTVPSSAAATTSRVHATGALSTAYAAALSQNVAAEADKDSATTRFREQYLPGGLLSLDEVEDWIDQRVARGDHSRQARVRLPATWERGSPLPSDTIVDEVAVQVMSFVVPGDTHVRKVVVAPGTELSRLKALSESLAVAFGWEPAQACTWVLTGVTPAIGLIRVTQRTDNVRDSRWMAWCDRIILKVHPAALPHEVADAYRAARARMDHDRTGGAYRARSQSIPHLVLARFVAEQRPRPTWSEVRRRWNLWIKTQTEYSDVKLKRYDSDNTFRNAATLACNRVLYRGHYAGRRGAAAARADDDG
jgi:hypothetical protein